MMRRFFIIFSFLGLVGCMQNTVNRGYTIDEARIDAITIGVDRKAQIQAMLGSPTTQSDFNADKWYYIYNKKEYIGFSLPKTVTQNVIAIEFDKKTDRVKSLKRYSEKDLRPVSLVTERTPTEGHDLGIAEQLLGNIGRFNPEGGTLERAMERNR